MNAPWRGDGADGSDGAPLLALRGLNVTFPGGPAVRELDLTVRRNEVLALVGESGCGKSVTAAAILGLQPARARVSGQILFHGRDLLAMPEREREALRGRRIAMVFQDPMSALNPVLTIGRQIEEVLRRHLNLRPQAARARAIELLDLVRLPEPQRRIDDHPHQLSGGQRQRVMIAIAVACGPELLIADEPTTALDVTVQAQILALLDSLRRQLAMGLLLITHDLAVVGQWADRVAVMHGGRKLEEGSRDDIFFAPQHAYTRGLLGASLHMGQQHHYSAVRLAEIRSADAAPTAAGSGATFTFVPQQPQRPGLAAAPAPDAAPLLEVRQLRAQYSSHYGTISALKDVSFEIGAGQTVGLVGESGCGKSTLSKTIVGLNPAVGGQVLLDGVDLTALHGKALLPYRRGVQLVFQDPSASLNPRMTVAQMLDEVLLVHGLGDRNGRARQVAAMVDAVGLPATALRRHAHELSGGQRQRVGIARALILRPKLLICDEPVSALDVSVRAQILNLFVDLKEEFGLSYLFISHDLAVVDYMADQVLVMQSGQIVDRLDKHTLSGQPSHPYHPYTRTLMAAAPSWPQEYGQPAYGQPAYDLPAALAAHGARRA
jgi:peptide/nickel transport system ATP-binding protein